MSSINRQSILKAFYQFDKKQLPLTNINGEPVGDTRDVGVRKQLCHDWLEAFDGLDNAVWDKVIEVVQSECKEFPSIDELYDIIDRLTAPTETGPLDVKLTETAPSVLPPPAKDCVVKSTDKIKIMFELAKQGEFGEARKIVEYAAAPANTIRTYAKQHWPDCTDAWIAANKSELAELVRYDERCSKCYSAFDCPYHGYRSYGQINKFTGGLSIMTAICVKKREGLAEKK